MTLSVGETVGPYRIVEQLGQGGMATVFRAYHAALDRYVAIKVMHPAFKADPTFLARFQREARVVARLEHPNIVPIYDYAEHEGTPFLIMKFIPGETLKARLARSPLSAPEVMRCVQAVGSALEFAHGQGVLHRDIKPSNIMLAADGGIYLTDFGLARIAQAGESTISADTLLGTPSYMSPEQARGDRELDAGTDIYSFGVVAYELMVGRVPFSADTPYAVIHHHIFTPLPPPRGINPYVPEAAAAVLTKALAKDRANRYGSISNLVADLQRALEPQATAGLPSSDRGSTLAPAPAIGAAPDAITPAGPSSSNAAPSAVVAPTAADALPLAAAETIRRGPSPPVAASSPYRLQWWQLVIGVILVGGCALLTLGALARIRRQSAAATQTASAVLAATAAPAAPTLAEIAVTLLATVAPAGTLAPNATASIAQQDLLAAERAFVAGQTAAGLTQLDQAVAADPNDTEVLLRAGDLALAQKLAAESLKRFYVPGVRLEAVAPDTRSGGLQSHAALAFYVAAADQASGSLLAGQVTTYPQAAVPLIAQQRYQIFFAKGQGALTQLTGISMDNAPGALAKLVLGDYYLARGQLLEASRQYSQVADVRLANGLVPDWIIRESRCDLDTIKNQRANAKVEASCVDLLLLLTGK